MSEFQTVKDWFGDRSIVLATMHQKEQAIAPIFLAELGLKILVPPQFNTDVFGTFSREIKRPGDQRETARLKAEKAMERTGTSLAIASEGSFAPHPALPMLPCNRELIVLVDRLHDLELVAEVISTETNFSHRSVSTPEAAYAFAQKIGFPSHGVIVMVSSTSTDASDMIKGITTQDQLQAAVAQAFARSTTGTIHLETDMRAMHNPTRMKVIAQATHQLVQTLKHPCPRCATPGFAVVDRLSGLPCELCGAPTNSIRAHIHACQKCGLTQEIPAAHGKRFADPMYCSYCNP